jgi:hypothetical protein
MLKTALLVVLATTFAQVFPSCGGGGGTTDVVGWVEVKKVEPGGQRGFIITINSVDYDVPGYFWQQVAIGDLVKWDGTTWTIVKKRTASSGLIDLV